MCLIQSIAGDDHHLPPPPVTNYATCKGNKRRYYRPNALRSRIMIKESTGNELRKILIARHFKLANEQGK
jgi:hypothetical protein